MNKADADIRVDLLEEKEIKKDYWYPNTPVFGNDGTIILTVQGRLNEKSLVTYSQDSGATCTEKAIFDPVKYMDEAGIRIYDLELLRSHIPILGQPTLLSDGSVTDHHAQWGQCSSGYTSIHESAPGVLLLLYDDVLTDDGGMPHNVVKMRKYRVS